VKRNTTIIIILLFLKQQILINNQISAQNEYRPVKHDNDCYNSLVYTVI